MTLELAGRSITRPKGVAEDVFVKVGKFHFPIDFVVVDFKADPRVPLILGRSFLRTDRALIDVYGEEITLWVNDESTQPKPNIPYPSRLNDQKLREKATNQIEKFFQIFHYLHFDISFADALLLMPKFASVIKSLLTNKDKLFELAKKKLSLPELTPTQMTLELAGRSITHPKGVAEDVFVKVGKFHFPIDFVVVDFKADPRVPLILGRSFLRTDRALIDVYGEEITLRVNDES
nr:hypothetical protein [Tanacetum cinerariifolium]